MSLNVNVLVTARDEYISQLMAILIPYFKTNFKKIFENSQKNSFIKYKLRLFQEDLRDIQRWNEVTVDNRVRELINQYPYFAELLKAIFVINVKILSCVKTRSGGKGIKIEVPNVTLFLHKLFIEIARKLYYKPSIILSEDEDIEELVENVITEILRNQIPIQQILQEYLMDTFDDSSDEDTDEPEEEEIPEETPEEPHIDEPKEIQPEHEDMPIQQPPTTPTEENTLPQSYENNEHKPEQPHIDDENYSSNNDRVPTRPMGDYNQEEQQRPRRVLFDDAKDFSE